MSSAGDVPRDTENGNAFSTFVLPSSVIFGGTPPGSSIGSNAPQLFDSPLFQSTARSTGPWWADVEDNPPSHSQSNDVDVVSPTPRVVFVQSCMSKTKKVAPLRSGKHTIYGRRSTGFELAEEAKKAFPVEKLQLLSVRRSRILVSTFDACVLSNYYMLRSQGLRRPSIENRLVNWVWLYDNDRAFMSGQHDFMLVYALLSCPYKSLCKFWWTENGTSGQMGPPATKATPEAIEWVFRLDVTESWGFFIAGALLVQQRGPDEDSASPVAKPRAVGFSSDPTLHAVNIDNIMKNCAEAQQMQSVKDMDSLIETDEYFGDVCRILEDDFMQLYGDVEMEAVEYIVPETPPEYQGDDRYYEQRLGTRLGHIENKENVPPGEDHLVGNKRKKTLVNHSHYSAFRSPQCP